MGTFNLFVVLLILTGVSVTFFLVLAYRRASDPFHPVAIIGSMFMVLYVILPFGLLYEGRIKTFFSAGQLEFVQIINLLGVTSFLVGCMLGSRTLYSGYSGSSENFWGERKNSFFLLIGGVLLGGFGCIGYFSGIYNVGGIAEAYSSAYGGGWSESGYLREAVLLCVPAITLVFLSRGGKDIPLAYWITVIFFSIPLLLHGFLGARRAPIFLLITVLLFSWYVIKKRRPNVIFALVGGLCMGLLLLFIVSNRTSFYVGSEWKFENSPFQYFETLTGNEYIYGSGSILHFSITEDYYWGLRYFATIFIRPIPSQIWPDKYEDVGLGHIEHNFGTGGPEFMWTLGWPGARGAAPGLVADMWVEFWWFSIPVLFGIGWCYGRGWLMAMKKGGFYTCIYILMASLSLFLVFQTLQAMLFRFLFMVIPPWLIWLWAYSGTRYRYSMNRSPFGLEKVEKHRRFL